MPTNRLIIATHNQHKTEEFRDLLGDAFDKILDLSCFADIPAADENGTSFEENSTIKAVEASRSPALTDALVIADDSGLEVDALDGAPGIHSSRYSGDHATDAGNRVKLLEALRSVTDPASRTARFRCVIVVARNGKKCAAFHGTVEGRISEKETGSGGFGYDALFVPDGYSESFAELPSAVKKSISHRARALAEARAYLTSPEQ